MSPNTPAPTLEFQSRVHTLTIAQLLAGATTQVTTGTAVEFNVPALPAGPVLVLPAANRTKQLCIISPVDAPGEVFIGSSNGITSLLSAPLWPGNLVNIPNGAYIGPLWALNANNVADTIFTVSI